MGFVARLLSFTRVFRNDAYSTDVKVDPGGGANVTLPHFSAPGDDAAPFPDDFVAAVEVPRTGGAVAVGYVDPNNEGVAQPGEKIIYARSTSAGHEVVVRVHLKNDGSALVSNNNGTFELSQTGGIKGSNGNGSFELETGGNFVVNGVTIDTGGNIKTGASIESKSVIADGKELAGHVHFGVKGGGSYTQPNR